MSNLTRSRIVEFYKLYLPSALAIGSDFWRVTVIGVLAARQGALEVAVFNVGYRFLWICLMFSGALARAAGIQIAIAIGNSSVAVAQGIAKVLLNMGAICHNKSLFVDRFDTGLPWLSHSLCCCLLLPGKLGRYILQGRGVYQQSCGSKLATCCTGGVHEPHCGSGG